MSHIRLPLLSGAAPTGTPVFPGLEPATAWRALQYLVLPSGVRCDFPAAADREVGYLLLEGALTLAGSALETQLEGPADL